MTCRKSFQTYEYKMEFDNYLGASGKDGLIEKHVKRHNWLVENIVQVQPKLGLPAKLNIKSPVISKNILPLNMPIISFYELKTKHVQTLITTISNHADRF